jgi:hypothetical protein
MSGVCEEETRGAGRAASALQGCRAGLHVEQERNEKRIRACTGSPTLKNPGRIFQKNY